jgi:tetratricopeptide (TPR) repeat protein
MKSAERILIIVLVVMASACSTPRVVKEKPAAETKPGSAESAAKKPAVKPVDPQAQQAYSNALEAMQQEDYQRALSLLTSMTQAHPELSGPYTNIGIIHYRAGRLQEAQDAFKQAVVVNPQNAVAYNHLGIAQRESGLFNDAEQSYLKAIEQQPDFANAHLNLGILYDIYLLQLDKALQHYQQFQTLQQTEDPTVKNWVIGLQRRLKVSK